MMTHTEALKKLSIEHALIQGLIEYLQELGYDTTTSTIWEARVWAGQENKRTCLSIRTTDDGWHITYVMAPINTLPTSTTIPYEEPMENLAHFIEKLRK